MYHVNIDGRVVYWTTDYRTAKMQFKRVRSRYLFLEVFLDFDNIICN